MKKLSAMNKNINLGYLLGFLRACWFWLGVWVFYYLMFTDYAGIGLLESVMIITWILMEIPTGALSDLIGKKKALILAFLLLGFGNIIMGGAVSFFTLGLGIFIGSIGLAFFSGTHEAFLYDTLKSYGQELKFDNVIGKTNGFNQLGMAVGGILSGVLYSFSPRLPYFLVGIFGLIGAMISLFLEEPKVDSERFSIKQFIEQNKAGVTQLRQLLRNVPIMPIIFGVASVWVISDEMLESVLAVEYGFSPQLIGPFFALLFLISAGASTLTPILNRRFHINTLLIVLGLVLAVSYIVSPFVGILFGGVMMILRESIMRIFNNGTSIVINNHTSSNIRVTTLSTFSMVKNLPYAAVAFFMGIWMDKITSQWVAFYLGSGLAVLLVVYWAIIRFRKV